MLVDPWLTEFHKRLPSWSHNALSTSSVGRGSQVFPTADSYLEHFLAVSRAIRSVHAGVQIGMAIARRSPAWGNDVLKQAAGRYDFVVGHY